MLRFIIFLYTVFFALHPIFAQNYQAVINYRGYQGVVTFQPDTNSMNVTVSFTSGENVNALSTFEVASLPAVFGQQRNATKVCDNLGTTIKNLTGALNGTTVTIPNLVVNNIFNRGLRVISNTGMILCATILPVDTSAVTTSKARFSGDIVGEMYIRTRAQTAGIFLYYNLAYSSNTITNVAGTTSLLLWSYTGGNITSSPGPEGCRNIGSRTSLNLSISVGNSALSSGKMNSLFAEDLTNAMGTHFGLINGTTILACSEIREVASKTVRADIFWDDVRGSVSMTQQSIFDPTHTAVLFSSMREVQSKYHVHDYPVPQRLTSSEQRCNAANVGGHLNPYGIDINESPTPGSGTGDQYEIGDLSGKYGKLDSTTINASYVDWNLPLFGPYSVVGRSIVVHYPDDSRWVCASLGYPSEVITAVAKFKYPAFGYVYLRQVTGNPDADTSIFINLANMNESLTSGHNFGVVDSSNGIDCSKLGPLYNPSGLSQSSSCTSMDPLQCRVGDLSGRFGAIKIGSNMFQQGNKFFFTDSYLPLQGLDSILGKSIVVYKSESSTSPYACANVVRMWATTVQTTNTWAGNASDGTVTGSLTFTQVYQFDRTKVESTVEGLNNMANTYNIRTLPLSSAKSKLGIAQCSISDVKTNYNPFRVLTMLPAAAFTYDKYEVGDLSGKYGLINGTNSITLHSIRDNNLPLTTPSVSSVGRSVLIQKTPNGSSWKCNNLDLVPSDNTGYLIKAIVQYKTSVIGFINLEQVVYENGFSSVTTLLVDLYNSNFVTTPNHNWHIHIDPITNQNECMTAKGHFDPYMAKNTTSNYSAQCNRQNPLACELGDISKKQEQYTIETGNRQFFVDVDVPLHTEYTVLGRSIVFHEQNGGDGRQVCANILPTDNVYTLAFASTVSYDYNTFTTAVASSLGIAKLRVVVMHNTNVPVSGMGCSKVMVYIAGTVSNTKINELLSGSNAALRPYNPTGNCKSESGAKVIGMSELKGGSTATKPNIVASVLATMLSVLLLKTFD